LKTLLLGGTGFVGKNVVNVLTDNNFLTLISSKSGGQNLLNYEQTFEYFQQIKPDIVINLAANVGSLNYVTQQAAEIFDINMRMLLNVYKAITLTNSKILLINPIANCGYPGNLENYTEDKFWEGKVHQSVLAYGNTRRMIDVLSDAYKMQFGLRTINFFVPNMYGPYDSIDPNKAHALNALVSKVVKAKFENSRNIEVWGSGVAIREWLYAKDFGRVLVHILNNPIEVGFDEPINIAQNLGLSVRELINLIIKETGFKGEIIWNKNMPDGAPRKVMDDSRFRRIFKQFSFTSLEDGLHETIKYYESIYPY